jgi:hypothetical protein
LRSGCSGGCTPPRFGERRLAGSPGNRCAGGFDASGRRADGGGAVAPAAGGWGAAGDGVASLASGRGWAGAGRLTGGAPAEPFSGRSRLSRLGAAGGRERSVMGRSTVLCPNCGRGGTEAGSRRAGAVTRCGAGVGTPAGPTIRSSRGADSARTCGGRVATTDRFRLASGGRMPRLAVGTRLAGVAVTLGAVRIGWRLFTSTRVMRPEVMGPRPK